MEKELLLLLLRHKIFKHMNTFKLAFFILLLSSATAFSQNNDYNRNGSINRDIGSDYSNQKKPSPADTEKAKAEHIDKIIAKIKAALTLDELQTIAIKNEFLSSSKNIDIVAKKEISEEDKSKEIKALAERTEIVIKSYLNSEQKEKYSALIEESRAGKKDKKSKKKDKTAEE